MAICHYIFAAFSFILGLAIMLIVLWDSLWNEDQLAKVLDVDLQSLITIPLGISAFVLCGGWGMVNFISGRLIANRRWRIPSMLVAVLNCLTSILGLALGIYTLVILNRPAVRKLYGENAEVFSKRRY